MTTQSTVGGLAWSSPAGVGRRAAILTLFGGVSLAAGEAGAAGPTGSGVQPLGRAGAFVAGATTPVPSPTIQPGSSTQGSSSCGRLVANTGKYQRTARVTAADDVTIRAYLRDGGGHEPGAADPDASVCGSFGQKAELCPRRMGSYAAITSYPETVGGKPAPQRYSPLARRLVMAVPRLRRALQRLLRAWRGSQVLTGHFDQRGLQREILRRTSSERRRTRTTTR